MRTSSYACAIAKVLAGHSRSLGRLRFKSAKGVALGEYMTVAVTELEAAYEAKARSYFAGARVDFVSLLPHDPSAHILEIGCGSGDTGALALAGDRAGRYTGVELMPGPAAEARKVLTDVLVGDVEQMAFDWQPAAFDAIILSEVLEHLTDPRRLLNRLARYVRPGGKVLASSPNISHWRVLRHLMAGQFPQADRGVFDRTHLRWFTPATFAEMFDAAGFDVDHVGPVTSFSPRTQMISRATGGRLDHLFMTQISLLGTKRS